MFSSVHVQFTFFSQTDKHPLISSFQFMFSSLPTSRTYYFTRGSNTYTYMCEVRRTRVHVDRHNACTRLTVSKVTHHISVSVSHKSARNQAYTHAFSHIELVCCRGTGGSDRCSLGVHVQFSSVHVQFSPKISEHPTLETAAWLWGW